MTERLHPLQAIRYANDWTYRELAADIAAKTGYHRDQDCWRKICTGLTVNEHSRTKFILDKYLERYRRRQQRDAREAAV